MAAPARGRRRWRIVLAAVVILAAVAAGFGIHALYDTATRAFATDDCTVGSYDVDTGQAAVAAQMVGAVTQFRPALPERATVLVLAAALQESKLTNIAPGQGDRDSVGVLQQRPSQGWGEVSGAPNTIADRTTRLTDVSEATKEFLTQLVKVPNWQTIPLADAVQAVQISADGSAYAPHEGEAQALADALQGVRPAAISCDFQAPTEVAAPSVVAAQARDQLGITSPSAVSGGVRVPGAHWQTAAWFVANGDRLGIARVSYAGRTWTRTGGWARTASVSAAAVTATMYVPPK